MTDNISSAMRNGKTVVTNFTKCVIFFFFCYCARQRFIAALPHNRRILTATMYGHFAVYESLNSCTRAHFCCGLLEVGSPISAFRFSLSHIKNTMPSGDIPRDNYQQHCQYRLRGLRCIACGLASSIINRSMHISNRWRHILSKKLP